MIQDMFVEPVDRVLSSLSICVNQCLRIPVEAKIWFIFWHGDHKTISPVAIDKNSTLKHFHYSSKWKYCHTAWKQKPMDSHPFQTNRIRGYFKCMMQILQHIVQNLPMLQYWSMALNNLFTNPTIRAINWALEGSKGMLKNIVR